MAARTAALFGLDDRQVGALFGGFKWFCLLDLPLDHVFFWGLGLSMAFPCQAARTKYCEPQLCNECMREPR